MTYRDAPKTVLMLLAGGLGLAACSTQPQPNAALDQARTTYSAASGNPETARFGAYPLAEARENLVTAQQAWSNNESPDKVTHYANLAQTQSQIAQAVAKRRMAQGETINQGREITLGDMLFRVGKADLNPQGDEAVARLASFLKNYPDRTVSVIGYTDSTGSAKLNAKLSEERAAAVKTGLVKDGVPANRIATAGRGPANPVASNATAEGRQKNRRVAVDISGPGGERAGSTSPAQSGSTPAQSGSTSPSQ